MKTGLFWFDDDTIRAVSEKVARAAAHYQRKYGQAATLCFVNPVALPDGEILVGAIRVKPSKTVLPNHFWLGREEG